MRMGLFGLIGVAALATSARAHFLYVTPFADGSGYGVLFSDTPAPDPRVSQEPLEKLKLRGWNGDAPGRDLAPAAPADGVAKVTTDLPVAAGSAVYGVVRRGDESPVLITFHAKSVKPGAAGKPVGLPLELTPVDRPGGVAFLLTEGGQPLMGHEVLVHVPGEAHPAAVRTGADGVTPSFSAAGGYAARAYRTSTTPGEYAGRKYGATRHYSTLTTTVAK